MARLIHSQDIYSSSKIAFHSNGEAVIQNDGKNLGSLPTLYDKEGHFISVINSWFFDLKAIRKLEDLSSYSRALLSYWSFLESQELAWNVFPPIKRLKPTYLFRSHLMTEIKEGALAHSTASHYMSHVVQFYLWTMHEGYLRVKNEKTAPFTIEFVTVHRHDKLAHIKPTFTVQTSDLRIKVPKQSQSNTVNSMSPLSRESLHLVAQELVNEPIEFRLQCLLGLQCGLRLEEASSITLEVLNNARPTNEGKTRYAMLIGLSNGVKTKYDKPRTIEISSQLLNTLQNYAISERRLKRVNKLDDKIEQINMGTLSIPKLKLVEFQRCEQFEPLFVSDQGNPVDGKVTGARWTDFRQKVRQDDPSFHHKFHDLRCTYGTYRLHDLLEAGLEGSEALDCLMAWMGHNHEQTTWKYLRYLKRKDALRDKFALLDTLMHEAVEVVTI